MSTILVTGASGFVARSLITEIKASGNRVVGVSRVPSVSEADEFFSVPDFAVNGVWKRPLESCDIVMHLAARVHVMNDSSDNPLAEFRKTNVDGTLNLAKQASLAGVKRFIFVSSIKVNGEYTETGVPFTEADLPKPQDAYGISKLEAEQGLMLIAQQTGMEVVIIRPPLVYGAGVKANFASMLRMVARGIPLPLGAIYNKRSLVYIDNLISLILKCIEHPAAVNQVFLVSDGHDLSTTELLRGCAAALGVKARLLPIPQKPLEAFAAMIGKKDVAQRLCGNLQVDISKARSLLGWIPPVSVEEGLRATAEDFNKVNK